MKVTLNHKNNLRDRFSSQNYMKTRYNTCSYHYLLKNHIWSWHWPLTLNSALLAQTVHGGKDVLFIINIHTFSRITYSNQPEWWDAGSHNTPGFSANVLTKLTCVGSGPAWKVHTNVYIKRTIKQSGFKIQRGWLVNIIVAALWSKIIDQHQSFNPPNTKVPILVTPKFQSS